MSERVFWDDGQIVRREGEPPTYYDEADHLQREYDKAVKECLGRLLPIQHHGHMLSLGDLRDQLRTGMPYRAAYCRCASHGCKGWVD